MSVFAAGLPLIKSNWIPEQIWIGHLHLPSLNSLSTSPTSLALLFLFFSIFDVSSLSLFLLSRGGTDFPL